MSRLLTAPTIRAAEPADSEALANLGRRTFSDTFADSNTPEDLRQYLDAAFSPAMQRCELLDASIHTLVADRDGALLAFAQLRQGKVPPGVFDPTAIEIQRFYVDRSAQGSGLAQLLMAACLSHARAAGAGTICLGVWERNERAIRFYQRIGFTTVGRQVFRLGSDDQQDLVMSRALTPADVPTA